MSILNIHNGKRTVIAEKEIETKDPRMVIFCVLAKSLGKTESVMHIQKSIRNFTNNELSPMKGGVMIDVELLPALKSVVDEFYIKAIDEGLIKY